MFSVSPAELLTIAVVALLVFGPRRLPEIARKAGKVIRDLRTAAEGFKSEIESEYGDTLAPLDEARREMRSALGDVERATRPPLVPPRPGHGGTPPPDEDDETPPNGGALEQPGDAAPPPTAEGES